MKHRRLWSILCLMTVWYRLGMSSRYGCLFEKRLCSREQLCSDDGLFGQCHGSSQERVQYQVSMSVLQRLHEVLKMLMMQGLSWKDDITQYVIAKELRHVPQAGPRDTPLSQPSLSSEKTASKLARPSSGSQAQQYMDYMILPDPPQASLHLQSQLLDPYTYHQYGYQGEEERSLNSLDAAGYPRSSSRSGGNRNQPRGRDEQLLQDVVSLYLSPAQPPSRHRVAAGGPNSHFYQELEFPLDYTENYISQEEEVATQQEQKKAPQNYSPLSGLDDATWQRFAALLKQYGLDVKELSSQQLQNLAAALQLMEADTTEAPDQYQSDGITIKMAALMEGAMRHRGEKAPAPAPSPQSAARPPLSPEQPPATGPPQVLTVTLGGGATGQGASVPAEGAELSGKTSAGPSGGPRVGGDVQSPEGYGLIITNQSVAAPALVFRVQQNQTAEDETDKAVAEKTFPQSEMNLNILQTGVGQRSDGQGSPQATRVRDSSRRVFLTLVGVACVGGILVTGLTIVCLRHHARLLAAGKLGLGLEGGGDTHYEYRDLCRQHMASKSSSGRQEGGGRGGGGGTDTSRVSSVSSQFSDGPQPSPSSHSSTPSWCEEPAQSNMDISTGHMILAYMEDHLKNKDRLVREWEALCSYQAEPSATSAAQSEGNVKKNRNPEFVPYDHSRVKLRPEINPSRADYINASIIIEHDPRMPAYIATQGPLSHTIADFWQMVWENGCTVIVMMTALVEDGQKQCDRYWPDEGSSLYHIYEVNLVSEHIWCNDFLVRSFYLKNVQTQETRTLTQFHFLSWPAQGIPTSTRPLLDFRRKVNKCYRGRSCPIIVHCSDGTGRTGTYILVDMVLNRMAKGVKEIDIAATLEHIRDQRPGMVRTKDQFEFALTAVAEEVNAILKALPQ
ncbi:receptor-type tyrosine-protein phosphatase-like N [Megalops cyprinoides]|uniref:receptor-type tyrosine-protein phosphatase-like N n=1 Tax=Megalops cyprinoides TaxID=118141 RepID=UPI0018646BA3|nr:receptor-type tyrosine-protein phosphatase-like N [Megalops cyprinoides]